MMVLINPWDKQWVKELDELIENMGFKPIMTYKKVSITCIWCKPGPILQVAYSYMEDVQGDLHQKECVFDKRYDLDDPMLRHITKFCKRWTKIDSAVTPFSKVAIVSDLNHPISIAIATCAIRRPVEDIEVIENKQVDAEYDAYLMKLMDNME